MTADEQPIDHRRDDVTPAGETSSPLATSPVTSGGRSWGDRIRGLGARVARPGPWTTFFLLALILGVGAFLRFRGLDWDSGHHLHPDERFLTMVGSSLGTPQDFLGYLDTDTSPLNPRNRGHQFLSYGTWSITLVYLVASRLDMTSYGQIYLVGRALSGVADLVTILLVFALAARLYDRRVGLVASALTAFTAFHIQQAHFYTVEAPLTAFVMLALTGLTYALTSEGWRRYLWWLIAGVGLGMALGTKVSVWLLAPVAVVAIIANELRRGDRGHGLGWDASVARALGRAALQVTLLGTVSLVSLKVAQPDMFAGPGWPNVVANETRFMEVTAGTWHAPEWWFTVRGLMPDPLEMYLLPDPRWADSMHRIQSQVTGFGMDWPPNHQWWGRVAYWFPWKNMVRWGMGVPLGIAATVGWLAMGRSIWRGDRRHLALWLWVAAFFGFAGIQWAKTMRYFLPIYPALTIMAAWWSVRWLVRAAEGASQPEPDVGTVELTDGEPHRWWQVRWWSRRPSVAWGVFATLLGGTALWGLMFSQIYARDHSQVAASEWMYHNLPTAFGVRIADGGDGTGEIAGPWLPAQMPSDLTVEDFGYVVEDPRWIGPMRVLLPYGAPDDGAPAEAEGPSVEVDGARLGYVSDPLGQGRDVPLEVVLARSAHRGEDGRPAQPIVTGRAVADLSPDGGESHVVVPFGDTASLTPGGEYYLWVSLEDPPIAGRTSVLAYETPWDLPVPHGMRGYAAYDDPNTTWAEGLFGVVNFEMYGENAVDWPLENIARVDYWVSPTNRVYGAIRQLPMRFAQSIAFYDEVLFGERLGWRMLADIHSYPGFGPLEIPDQAAEEAFHVYDHPRVVIWEKTDAFDVEALRAMLEPLETEQGWRFPPVAERPLGRFLDALLGRIPVERGLAPPPPMGPICGFLTDVRGRPVGAEPVDPAGPRDGGHWCRRIDALLPFGGPVDPNTPPASAAEAERPPVEAVMLSASERETQRRGGTFAEIFNPDAPINRSQLLALLGWYAVLSVLGLVALPWLAIALPRFADAGWSVARTAGLLVVSWAAWSIGSIGWAAHTPWLVTGVVAVLAVLTLGLLALRPDVRTRLRQRRLAIGASEVVFLAIFLLFTLIRASNPDLWHPWKGGEKPMDFAYFNAVLKTVHFPPYDPWFAGGQLNYYYFGFAFIGALVELTRIVPHIAYNLAIPTLAAMTGTAAYGIVATWIGAQFETGEAALARAGGLLAAALAVISGNLYQVRFLTSRWCEVSPWTLESDLPGVSRVVCTVGGAWADLTDRATLAVRTEHWYWNASRAIPAVEGDVQPITEFPMFTFLYGDLHAHMMAMPIAMLAVAIALAWALPLPVRHWRMPLVSGGAALRMGLGALAVGALWPTNTWDFPTYGLVMAGGLAVGALSSAGRPNLEWLARVAIPGALLLGLSLLLFLPYHLEYVTPYADFSAWTDRKTPVGAYITVHGLFLFAIVSWALVRVWRMVRKRLATSLLLVGIGLFLALSAYGLWAWSLAVIPPHLPTPGPGTPFTIAALLTFGVALCLRPGAKPADRFGAWLFFVGALLTGFVEYVVLSGDIGRMNTVFKFYIQVWLLWAMLAAYAAATLTPMLRGAPWGRLWHAAFVALLVAGFLYPVTAIPARAGDRFPAMAGAEPPPSGRWQDHWTFGLRGEAFADYAVYDDDGFPLTLAHDLDAIRWMREEVEGTPTILEGYRVKAYRWGGRYSIYTGLPTVVGWDWHQKQQRNAVGPWIVDDRTRDVAQIYNSIDEDAAWRLLQDYGVEYVIVGEMERAFYDAAGLSKFDRWAERGRIDEAYRNEGVTIYRLPDEGASASRDDAPRSGRGTTDHPSAGVHALLSRGGR